MSAYVFLQTVEEIGTWSFLTGRGCVSAYPTLPMTPYYPNMRRPVVISFQQQWALSEDKPKDMWDITMPTIQWEELPSGQHGWHDLDRVGNVNWFYDQFSREWCEVEMEILESERFYHSIKWLHYC
ncbi:hypothetical protein BDD12DRAFT_899347 [Trichophaea hybrida]|nr:hypothetical protein BDD12DRAFT_899347 [Trichophaea hybrida]